MPGITSSAPHRAPLSPLRNDGTRYKEAIRAEKGPKFAHIHAVDSEHLQRVRNGMGHIGVRECRPLWEATKMRRIVFIILDAAIIT